MNSKQKAARLVGMIFVALAALFPPWRLTLEKAGASQSSAAGYHSLWNPPTGEVQVDSDQTKAHYRVDLIRLGVQLGIVLLVVNGAVYLLKEKARSTTSHS